VQIFWKIRAGGAGSNQLFFELFWRVCDFQCLGRAGLAPKNRSKLTKQLTESMRVVSCFVLLLCIVSMGFAAIDADIITSLPVRFFLL
jgi:hypothetical protein